jgi:HD domain
MNWRVFMQGIGLVALGTSMRGDLVPPPLGAIRFATPARRSPGLPKSVAGVRLVDSAIARAATELSLTVSPQYLFNHAMRTFLFGSLVGRAMGKSFDEEILYLACILHDLGLTDEFSGNMPFEIQGAQAPRGFLEKQSYATEKAKLCGTELPCMLPRSVSSSNQKLPLWVKVQGPMWSDLMRR